MIFKGWCGEPRLAATFFSRKKKEICLSPSLSRSTTMKFSSRDRTSPFFLLPPPPSPSPSSFLIVLSAPFSLPSLPLPTILWHPRVHARVFCLRAFFFSACSSFFSPTSSHAHTSRSSLARREKVLRHTAFFAPSSSLVLLFLISFLFLSFLFDAHRSLTCVHASSSSLLRKVERMEENSSVFLSLSVVPLSLALLCACSLTFSPLSLSSSPLSLLAPSHSLSLRLSLLLILPHCHSVHPLFVSLFCADAEERYASVARAMKIISVTHLCRSISASHVSPHHATPSLCPPSFSLSLSLSLVKTSLARGIFPRCLSSPYLSRYSLFLFSSISMSSSHRASLSFFRMPPPFSHCDFSLSFSSPIPLSVVCVTSHLPFPSPIPLSVVCVTSHLPFPSPIPLSVVCVTTSSFPSLVLVSSWERRKPFSSISLSLSRPPFYLSTSSLLYVCNIISSEFLYFLFSLD